MSQHTLLIFCLVTLTQTLSIGPAVSILLTNYFNFGFRSSLPLSIVFRCGESVTLFIAFLITSTLIASPVLFSVLKGAGGAYLFFIGVKAILKLISGMRRSAIARPVAKEGLFTAFLIPVVNPKALIYFTSFIPSFITTTGKPSYIVQFAILSLLFLLISFISDMCFLGIAAGAKKFIGDRISVIMSVISALFLIGTGLFFVLNVIGIV